MTRRVLAVLELGGDVVEERCCLVVAMRRRRDNHVFSRGAVSGSRGPSAIHGLRVRANRRPDVLVGRRAKGGARGNSFLHEILLVKFCVCRLEVIVRGGDVNFGLALPSRLALSVLPSTASAASSGAAVAGRVAACALLSAVPDAVVKAHLINFIRQILKCGVPVLLGLEVGFRLARCKTELGHCGGDGGRGLLRCRL